MGITVRIIHERKKANSQNDRRKLNIQVTHNRKSRAYCVPVHTYLSDDEFKNEKSKQHQKAKEEIAPYFAIAAEIKDQISDNFTFQRFKNLLDIRIKGQTKNSQSISSIYDLYIEDNGIKLTTKTKTSYKTAVNWFEQFHPNYSVGEYTTTIISQFRDYLQTNSTNISENSIRIYLRAIKALYNYAVKIGIIVNQFPFRDERMASSRKQNYGLEEPLFVRVVGFSSENNVAQRARDFFVLSFALSGANLVDIISLKNKNLCQIGKEMQLSFVRTKTKKVNKPITMLVPEYAMEIISKYGRVDATNPDGYVFPYLHNKNEKQIKNTITDFAKDLNKGLRQVATAIEIPSLTMGQARHTYATIAIRNGRDLFDLKNDLGHTDIKTTDGYINSISVEKLNQAKSIKEKFQ